MARQRRQRRMHRGHTDAVTNRRCSLDLDTHGASAPLALGGAVPWEDSALFPSNPWFLTRTECGAPMAPNQEVAHDLVLFPKLLTLWIEKGKRGRT